MTIPDLRVQLLALAALLLLVAVFVLRRILLRRTSDRALRDPLTGAYTADFMREVYQAELLRAERTGVPFSVALVALRDEDGPARPLPADAEVAAARWLRENLRGSDYIGRVAAGRFAVVLPETWEEDARIVLARIDRSFRHRPRGGPDRWLTCRVGMATWTPEEPEAWEKAERALEGALRAARLPSGSLAPTHLPPS
ncbi:MAG: GGDEF domain-containing protein [Armatimonadota bacterium]|nr:GGDEF domain-containing protein [Armatimonadota bacterium]MDR7400672.1 GGDEF domain-containing protein [Armatimonadota bacterium]MDR7403200.1 GGDEF domain-containing protein [Armatimonadota bacterium]MDR7436517.1 GGDEF domain-containing protein [Armatimonadota bacterium]MDR7472552.1 GGDEF domain-containing protein [Armatimonadota bacterium]